MGNRAIQTHLFGYTFTFQAVPSSYSESIISLQLSTALEGQYQPASPYSILHSAFIRQTHCTLTYNHRMIYEQFDLYVSERVCVQYMCA